MKIWQQYNKRTKRNEWRARFRLNKRAFRPQADTKRELELIIAEIRRQENREQNNKKYNTEIEVVSYIPTVAEVFEKVLPTIQKEHQRKLAERVSETFLSLLPAAIKVNELSTIHFQLYINHRSGQLGKQSNQPIRSATIAKEIYAATSTIKKSKLYYQSLEKWQMPELPELPKGFKRKSKRERLVSEKELSAVIAALIKEPQGKQTFTHYFHRVRLAHTLEFGFWTGLRRKEIARLKFSQFDDEQQALLNVKRWKTETVTRFFPLGKRALEIIAERCELQKGSDYIFTPNGEPIEASYRTLKKLCANLNIPYGRFVEGGFVSHDLRHNFASDVINHTDIKTASTLLGHSNVQQSLDYIHTNETKLREAIRKRDNLDYNSELKEIFEAVKSNELNELEFNEKIKKLFNF